MRIALIHALSHSVPAIVAAFGREWPDATLANLLDDSLSADLARDGALTPAMTERFLTLSRYAARCRADAILFTCSAFGPCIEACARDLAPLPVLRPNEAMIEEAVALAGRAAHLAASSGGRPAEGSAGSPAGRPTGSPAGSAAANPLGRIGLLASFAPMLQTMPAEFAAVAPGATVVPCLAAGALAALDRGDPDAHDRAAAAAATALADCDVIALGQFSLARAAPAVAAATGKPVLTTPESAIRKLKRLLLPAAKAA